MPGLTRRFLSLYALLPIVLTGWYVVRHAFPVPMYDEWVVIQPLVVAAFDGTLTPQSLTQVYFGHRQATSYVVTVALALLTGWDTRIDVAFSFGLALGCAALIVSSFRRVGLVTTPLRPVVLLAVTLLLFTPVQFINFVYGNAKCTWLLLAAVYGAGWVLSRPVTRRSWLILIGLALFASWSFLSGHLLWLIIPPLLWLRGQRRWRPYLVWMIVAVIQFVLYFGPGYQLMLPDAAAAAFDLRAVPALVLVFLGGPFSAHPRADAPLLLQSVGIAGLAGGIGITALAALTFAAWRTGWYRSAGAALTIGYLLVTFSLGSGLMVAVGRAGVPADVISSRFVTLAVPFWIGLIGLAVALFPALTPRLRALLTAASVVVLPALAALLLISAYKFYHVAPLPVGAVACVRDYQVECHQVLLGETLSALLLEPRLESAVDAVRMRGLSVFADSR